MNYFMNANYILPCSHRAINLPAISAIACVECAHQLSAFALLGSRLSKIFSLVRSPSFPYALASPPRRPTTFYLFSRISFALPRPFRSANNLMEVYLNSHGTASTRCPSSCHHQSRENIGWHQLRSTLSESSQITGSARKPSPGLRR